MTSSRRLRLIVAIVARVAPIAVLACVPRPDIAPDAQLLCDRGADCPRGTVCAFPERLERGRCLPEDSPCLTAALVVVADGTACGERRACSAGLCVEAGCGDGLVDRDGGEECDPGADRLCRDDCTRPVCGDGVLDANE